MMAPTHIMASVLFFLMLSPGFVSPNTLPFFILGALLPDLDIKADHRKSLHFPFIYLFLGLITYTASFHYLSALFLSAGLHCLMEVVGNDAGEYVKRKKGAVYDHLRGKWISGLNLIERDGGSRDLLLLFALSGITLVVSSSQEIFLITFVSLISGFLYFRIRDRVGDIFPDFILTK